MRQGVEFDIRARATDRLTLSTIGSVSRNRIREYFDNTAGGNGVVRRNVPPLLAPAVSGTQRIDWRVSRWLDIGGEARYQGDSFLRNDGNTELVLPAYWIIDAMVRVPFGRNDLTVRGTNLGNSTRFGSGYAVDDVPNYFVLTPRSVFVTLRIMTR